MINENKNVKLQTTLSKRDAEKLVEIQYSLNNMFDMDFTKSQAIAHLIKSYGKSVNRGSGAVANNKPVEVKGNMKYQGQVLALKDRLNLSWPKIAAKIGISENTLKKYSSGIQNPSGENETKLLQAFEKYGIK